MTPEQIKRLAPDAKPAYVKALVEGYPRMWARGINTPLRLQHFLAQIGHECGGFTIVEENLNYSADRLMVVWPTHFKSHDFAANFAHNPEGLANYIYADSNRPARSRLGNVRPGDGWLYRGRSFLQTTGRENYRAIGHEADPETLRDPAVGLDAAIDEFVRTGCLNLADQDELTAITLRINGGYNGIEERRRLLGLAKTIFVTVEPPAQPAQPPVSTPAPAPVQPTLPEPYIPRPQPRPEPQPEPAPTEPSAVTPVVVGGLLAVAVAAVSAFAEAVWHWILHFVGG